MRIDLLRLSAVLAMVLLIGGVLSAAGTREEPAATVRELTEPGTFPIVRDTATISIVRLDAPFYDHNTNWFTEYYTEKTNVETNMILVPGEQFKERINLMFASGDPIDLIVTANNGATIYTKSEQMQLYNQGVIRALNDLIDDHTFWLKERLDEFDGWREYITGPDGNIYGLPYITECYHCTAYNKMWLNVQWLENLGLEVPTTPDEFHEVLRAFKEQDANLNNDSNDEIPLSSSVGADFTWLDGYLMSAFLYSDGGDRLLVDDGRVHAAFVQPEYREGLRYLRNLYAEGLIYPESFVQDRGTQNALNSQKYENIIGATPAPHHGYVGSRPAGEMPRWFEYLAIPPLTGPTGVQTTRWDYFGKFGLRGGVGGFIPTAARNPEVAMRLVDWMYTDEGHMASRYGPEGITWERPAPGELGITGQPALWKGIPMDEGDEYYGNTHWPNFPHIETGEFRAGRVAPDSWYALDEANRPLGLEKFLHELTQDNYAPYAEPMENILPPLFVPLEDIEELSQIRATLYPYLDEAVALFTIGQMDIDRDWERHLQELNNLGLVRFLQIMQNAYDVSAFAQR